LTTGLKETQEARIRKIIIYAFFFFMSKKNRLMFKGKYSELIIDYHKILAA